MLGAIIRAVLRALAYRAIARAVPSRRRRKARPPVDWS